MVKSNIEKIVKFLFSDAYDCKIDTPFETLSYKDAINLYGTDKPDMRIIETLKDISELFNDTEINFLKEILDNGGLIKALHTEELLTRKQIDTLDAKIKEMGSNGLGWFKIDNSEISGPLAKLLNDSEKTEILKFGAGTLIFQAGEINSIAQYLDCLLYTSDAADE